MTLTVKLEHHQWTHKNGKNVTKNDLYTIFLFPFFYIKMHSKNGIKFFSFSRMAIDLIANNLHVKCWGSKLKLLSLCECRCWLFWNLNCSGSTKQVEWNFIERNFSDERWRRKFLCYLVQKFFIKFYFIWFFINRRANISISLPIFPLKYFRLIST